MACYRRKSTVWPGKLISSKKNTYKQPFLGDKYRHHLTLGRSGGQTVDTRSTSGVPLKSLGYNGSNDLCGRSVASKLSLQQADGFLMPLTFHIARLNRYTPNFSGVPQTVDTRSTSGVP